MYLLDIGSIPQVSRHPTYTGSNAEISKTVFVGVSSTFKVLISAKISSSGVKTAITLSLFLCLNIAGNKMQV